MKDVTNRELPIWRTAARTFSLLFRNFIPFGLLAIVFQLPGILYTQRQAVSAQGVPVQKLADIGFMLVNMFIGSILVGTITHSVLEQLQGRRGVVFESFQVGLKRILSVFAVNLVALILMMIGFMLLVVPGIIALTMFAVAVPAALAERRGVMDALDRSRELTRGNRIRIIGLGALTVGAIYTVMITAFLVFGFRGTRPDLETTRIYIMFFGSFIGLVVMVGEAVTYHALRAIQDGPSDAALAEVFD